MSVISVIVPVYKVEKYLSRCVDSILAQTFTDFELILVDDGSPDNSGKICDDYADKDSRVIVIHKENGGVSVARNIGTARAKGDYITYIDSDDWVTKDYFERLYNAITEFHAEIAITHPIITADENEKGIYRGVEYSLMTPREAIQYYGKPDSYAIRSPWGKLIHREIAQSVEFPAGRQYAEDAACVYQWYWKAKKIVDIQDKLYFYFSNSDSVCHEEFSFKRLGEYDTLREQISFYEENGFEELFQLSICRYLVSSVGVYQYLRAIHDQRADKLYDLAQNAVKDYFNSDGVVENYDQLMELYQEKKPDSMNMLIKLLFLRLTGVLPTHIEKMGGNELVRYEKKWMKMLILRYGKRHFPCREYPAAYEIVFPHFMKYYWIVYAQIKKLRRNKYAND